MSDYIIKVENLGKKYKIRHQQERQKYVAMRDVVANKAKGLGSSVISGIRSWVPGLGLNGTGPHKPTPDPQHLTPDTQPPATEDFWALKDVSFEVKPGEVIGIIGRNGAGKSTLLKVLSRITKPTEGNAKIRGRVASLLEVGTGFHPELTGRENIFMNGAILGMKTEEIKHAFDDIVAFAEVEQFLDTPVKRYSSGMYVRLAFAVAAHLKTEILIVDEVLAVGDRQFQQKTFGRLQAISEAGRSVLFVSHNLSAIQRICERTLLLQQGRLAADGSSSLVISQYLLQSKTSISKPTYTTSHTTEVKVSEVRIRDYQNNSLTLVNIETPFEIVIDYLTTIPNLKFRCSVSLFTQGYCAFVSIEPYEVAHGRPGRYQSSVKIPGNLLSEDEYIVGISIFQTKGSKYHYCKCDDVASFQVYDCISGGSARGDYTENLRGVLRPMLNWDTTYFGN